MKVQKGPKEDKVSQVMREFSEGKLKSSNGDLVTNKEQALAIALSQAGLSKKSLQKAEILSKAKVLKAQLNDMIKKELETEKGFKRELLEYFRGNSAPKDTEIHAIAEKYNVAPSEVEQTIYRILAEFLRGGLSKGRKTEVDPEEFKLGMQTEQEHSSEPAIVEKIVRDHLTEDPKYYSKLKAMEDGKDSNSASS